MNQKKKLIVMSTVSLLIVFSVYYLRNIQNIYYFESYQPPADCGAKKTSSVCYIGIIKVTTASGDEVLFGYTIADPPDIINTNGSLSSLKKGEKIQIKTSGDNTGDDKVVRSVRVIN